MNLQIRQARPADTASISAVLNEAAAWLEECNMQLWREAELSTDRVASDVENQLFFLAEVNGEIAGVVMFQLEDQIFWPDSAFGEAAYIHRLAIRRTYAGRGLSEQILRWAAQRTQVLGRRYLRLDCFADRLRLRAIYERFGFRYCDDRLVGPYHVARYQYDVASPPPRPAG